MNKVETIRYAIEKECCRNNLTEWCEEWGFTVEDFKRFMECEQSWIPCSDNMPDEGDCVLATTTRGEVWTLEYVFDGEEMVWDCGACTIPIDKVIAWMPLPKPYEEESSEVQ